MRRKAKPEQIVTPNRTMMGEAQTIVQCPCVMCGEEMLGKTVIWNGEQKTRCICLECIGGITKTISNGLLEGVLTISEDGKIERVGE